VLLEDFDLFSKFLVTQERSMGLTQIHIQPWEAEFESHSLPFDDETYTAYVGMNPEFDTTVLRFGYNSLVSPSSIYDYDMVTRQKTLLKQQEVVGGHDPSDYHSERIWAKAADGVLVPISLVYKKSTLKKDGNQPLLLYAYGSYGYSMDPYFSSNRLSLLQRGFVFAIAHIRGGEDLGRAWYEDGKLLKKKNTFTDFIACAEHLIQKNYTSPAHLYAMGGSAGGLLMGAVINMRADLFQGVVANVPFVDVVTTMLDESIPLSFKNGAIQRKKNSMSTCTPIPLTTMSQSRPIQICWLPQDCMIHRCNTGNLPSGWPSFGSSKQISIRYCYLPIWKQGMEVRQDASTP
jgi:oligopeptidase B